jgi:ABC-2 type transport system ATP-binding protein
VAVNNISFEVQRVKSSVLGPNGPQTTTFLLICQGLLTPTSGTAKVVGYDIIKENEAMRKRIG